MKLHYRLGPFGKILCWFGKHAWNFNCRCWYCGEDRIEWEKRRRGEVKP